MLQLEVELGNGNSVVTYEQQVSTLTALLALVAHFLSEFKLELSGSDRGVRNIFFAPVAVCHADGSTITIHGTDVQTQFLAYHPVVSVIAQSWQSFAFGVAEAETGTVPTAARLFALPDDGFKNRNLYWFLY